MHEIWNASSDIILPHCIVYFEWLSYICQFNQGPLEKWTETTKYRYEEGLELVRVPREFLDSTVWHTLILAILLHTIVFHP